MLDFEHARAHMVDAHIARRGVRDRRVLDAMRSIPREKFVNRGFEEFAYEDSPLPIGCGQTISQPFIVAYMIEAAQLKPGDRVLEVGTGSGYAAAVIAGLASDVFTIERQAELGQVAIKRLAELGFHNVKVRIADGSGGWPEKAPFDAILVAASGPSVPPTLKEQLELGGRLIMPVGSHGSQRLVRVTRVAAGKFEEEEMGGVMFVPLVGKYGWAETPAKQAPPVRTAAGLIEAAAELPAVQDSAFGALFDRFARHRVVLLGESTHGTSEFYLARSAITRRLIEEHGFSIIAIEADWPDAAQVNRYVRDMPPVEGTPPFRRFPTWMWRNREFDDFVRWLRARNRKRHPSRRAGIYGLDLYNMSGSIAAVLAYLDELDPDAAAVARERYGCLTPWQNEPEAYGRALRTAGYRTCEEAVVRQCRALLERELHYGDPMDDEFLDASQNARVIAAAEKYYRAMYYGGAETWNLRDRHMFETLEQMMRKRPDAKAVVWAHNSHIGDARHTDMGRVREQINLGQLCRERFGDEVVLIGFGTHTGTVAAASNWDGPMEIMNVRPSHESSVERLFHLSGQENILLDFARDERLREALAEPRLERFIGVIYRPETELASHYTEVSLSRQFDAFVWVKTTTAVTPLPGHVGPSEEADTFPFGL